MGIALDREVASREREDIRIAMESERMRNNLLRAVAHDLRSPLTALTGASRLLAEKLEELDREEQKRLATDISEEMIWLANLVENILNMTRIRENKFNLSLEDELVDDVVNEALSHVSGILKGRKFTVSLPDEVVLLPMDGKLVAQVLINLLDNAVRHTPADSEISLRVSVNDKDAVFEVRDTGNGIDESVRDTLFDGFVTYDSGVTDGKRGMGLGLAICKAGVEGHGGRITAKNTERGASFVFTLPLKGEDDGENPEHPGD
jgi:two-component system sensor histidine kinase KdpD